jgi:hypothetical protein
MILKKDNFILGIVLGTFAPVLGLLIFKMYKFTVFSIKETVQYLMVEPGYNTLSVALSLSLLMNALLFTIYINSGRDHTAKGIFVTTLIYGLLVLSIKTFL